MKTGFLFFFVEDYLLVGQLCTNPRSDRNLLSCLKVTQCSTSEIGDAPLYNSCTLPIQHDNIANPDDSTCLASEGVLRLCTLLSLAPLLPRPEPAGLLRWSYVENITNMNSHNTKPSLIAAIRLVFTELPPALVEKACSQFRIRIEVVIEAEGGYIK